MAQARDAVRTHLLSTKSYLNKDLVICLEGMHPIFPDAPFTLGPEDAVDLSGPGRVIWRGSQGSGLTGGLQVTGWSPTTLAGSPAFVAPLPATYPTNMPVRALWVAGARASRTQTNSSSLGTFTRWVSNDNSTVGFTVSNIPHTWANSTQSIEFTWAKALALWIQPRCCVASIDIAAGNITLTSPCGHLVDIREAHRGLHVPAPVGIEAALTALTPGMFWHDVPRALLYYSPAPGQTLGDLEGDAWVPASDLLLQLTNTTGHTFTGMSFMHSGWSQVNTPGGFVDAQSGVYNGGLEPPGAVRAGGVSGVSFANCTFTRLASPYAVEVANASSDSGITRSFFSDLSGGAVKLGGVRANAFSPAPSDWDTRLFLLDSFVNGSSVEYEGAAAVFAGYVQSTSISYNSITQASYSAISIGWGWGASFPLGFGNNTVAFNRIAQVMTRLGDGGGIYVNGAEDGTNGAQGWVSHMHGNFVNQSEAVYAVLYLDNGASFWNVSKNVAASSPKSWAVYMQGPPNSVPSARNSSVEDLWYMDCLDPKVNCVPEGCVTSNIVKVTGEWPEEALAIMAGAGPRGGGEGGLF